MTLICENKISAEVRLIHAEQISLYNFIILRKKQWTQMKTKQLKQDILNQQKSTVKSPCKRNNFRKRFKISRLVEVKLPFKQLFKAA